MEAIFCYRKFFSKFIVKTFLEGRYWWTLSFHVSFWWFIARILAQPVLYLQGVLPSSSFFSIPKWNVLLHKVTCTVPIFCSLHSYYQFRWCPGHVYIHHHKGSFRQHFLQWSPVINVFKRSCSLHRRLSTQKIPPMTSCVGSACRGQGRVGEESILRCKACVVSPYSVNEKQQVVSSE